MSLRDRSRGNPKVCHCEGTAVTVAISLGFCNTIGIASLPPCGEAGRSQWHVVRNDIFPSLTSFLNENWYNKIMVFGKRTAPFFGAIIILILFSISIHSVQAETYSTSGTLTSTNLLSEQGVSTINKFGYNASLIPANTTCRFSFPRQPRLEKFFRNN